LAILLRHCFRDGSGVQRSATFVDVLTVGRGMQKRRLNAAGPEQFRRLRRSGAVGAIHQNPQTAQVRVRIPGQPINIGASQARLSRQAGLGISGIRVRLRIL
jgi:hypothetical protein